MISRGSQEYCAGIECHDNHECLLLDSVLFSTMACPPQDIEEPWNIIIVSR